MISKDQILSRVAKALRSDRKDIKFRACLNRAEAMFKDDNLDRADFLLKLIDH